MSVFKAYDIRGLAHTELSQELAYRIGYYLPSLLSCTRVLVGRDVRESSPSLHQALLNGIMDAGSDVVDAGLCTTPLLYFAAGRYGYEASVQITASHNGPEYNGFKISGKNALPVGYDQGLQQLERMVQKAPVPLGRRGRVESQDFRKPYLDFLKAQTNDYLPQIPLVIDTSNGMGGLLAPSLFGNDATYLHLEPDGRFPAHDPNPLNADARKSLADTVRNRGANLGMIFDGDADRVMFVDEKGDFISPDLMIALLGHHFLPGKPPAKVLQDIRSSRAVAEYLAQWKAEVYTWRVGRAYAAPRLREISGLFGGELAGHYYFRDFFFSDSGMLAALLISRVVEEFARKGVPLSSVIKRIQPYHNSGEINFRIEEKQAAINEVVTHLPEGEEAVRKMDFDGFRLDFKDWWFNIRPSNTEPYLRFIAEARSPEMLQSKMMLLESILRRFQ